MQLVSAKGATKTGRQLRELLSKPGRESLKAMYSDDVAEFSVPVGGEGGLSVKHMEGLSLSS